MKQNVRTWINEWDVGVSKRRSPWQQITAPQLFAASFLFLILFGTLGLKILPGLYTTEPLGWLDALFTATSAVSITGLIVVDTATYFTPFGQAFILLLIQAGGLGVITFSSVIIISLGRRLSLRNEALVGNTAELTPFVSTKGLTRDIIRFTFALEIAGAILLYLLWAPQYGAVEAIWPAIFHSVSAFCNAGFSTFSDSLIGFQSDPATLLVFTTLIVLGAAGFLTLEELYLRQKSRARRRGFQLSVHTRLVLATTVVLLAGGALLFGIFEWTVALAEMPVWARPFNALFMSASGRTAGFGTIDYTEATESSNYLTIILMSIGGAPGSTAGGMKTTTVALIGLLAWSRLRGVGVVSIWGRTIPEETIQRAVGLFVVAFGVITAAIFAFTVTEVGTVRHAALEGDFLLHMFEAVSAFGTNGLSMGVTSDLSTAGQWITILLMYIGRVGPLTFAAAIALKSPTGRGEFRYAYEDVVVG